MAQCAPTDSDSCYGVTRIGVLQQTGSGVSPQHGSVCSDGQKVVLRFEKTPTARKLCYAVTRFGVLRQTESRFTV
ncbi:unnamed protein product [Ectocarpus sp. 8 AP-2014]